MFWSASLHERERLEDVNIDEGIILKYIVKKQGARLCRICKNYRVF
jgi:hypothetical protein